jgi:negative regulator of flagellin synthesis FlgM
MKIPDRKNPIAIAEAAGKRPEAERPPAIKPAATVEPSAVKHRDAVAAAIEQAQASSSTARSARLQELEAAIRQGTYKPDPQRIAERILESAEIAARVRASLLGG